MKSILFYADCKLPLPTVDTQGSLHAGPYSLVPTLKPIPLIGVFGFVVVPNLHIAKIVPKSK